MLRDALVLLILPAAVFADEFTGTVVSIADGDTVTVLRDHEQVKVRLAGIDAPERGQAFGTAARKYLGDQIAEKTVRVVWKERDRYGRTLGDVYIDDRWINRELVREGYAWHFTRYSRDKRLAEADTEAREKRRGLWQEREPIAPWEYRKREQDKRSPATSKSLFLPLDLRDPCNEIPDLVAVQFRYRRDAVDVAHEVLRGTQECRE